MKETAKAAQAWVDYLAMGPERSLEKLAKQYIAILPQYTSSTLETVLRILKRWSVNHGWQARLAAIAEQERAAIVARGIAEKQNRMNILDRTVKRIEALMDARAAEELNKAAGSNTGLVLVKDVAFVMSADGEETARVEKYATDGVVLKELREYLKQAAIETGQWTEKREVTGKMKLESLTDEELELLERLVRKTADS